MSSRTVRWLRRLLIVVIAIPVLAVLAGTGLWFVATSRIEAGVQQWIALSRTQGWTVTSGAPARGGWPLAAWVSYPGVSIAGAGPELPVPLTWQAGQIRVGITLADPHDLAIAGEGEEQIRFGSGPAVPFTGDTVELVTPLAGGATSLRAINLRVGVPGGAGPDGGLTATSLVAHGGPAGGGFQFDLDAVTVGLPQDYPWLFGPRIAAISLGGLLHGPLPVSTTVSPAAAATAWRNGGGTLELRRVALDWGPLKGVLAGTLGLDGDLQPMGAAQFHIDDYQAVLNALAASGRITRQAAMAATAVIALIGHSSDQGSGNGGSGSGADLALRLQDRTLSLGRIPLARMPEMLWPSP